jgi:hypothetical protein
MATDAKKLREAIAKLNARRYLAVLRDEITAHAQWRLAGGMSFAAVCRELDVGEPTLHGFLGSSRPSEKRRPGFAQVRVRGVTPTEVTASPRVIRGPAVWFWKGFRSKRSPSWCGAFRALAISESQAVWQPRVAERRSASSLKLWL